MKRIAAVALLGTAMTLLSTAMLNVAFSADAEESLTTLIPPVTMSAPTPTELAALNTESLTDNGATRVEVFEDGSGVQLINGTAVRSFPEDTFVWDCTVHGNRICGPTLPETI